MIAGDAFSRGIELQVPIGTTQGQIVESHKFALDNVFAPSSTQTEVFFQVSQLVQSAMDGFKVGGCPVLWACTNFKSWREKFAALLLCMNVSVV